MPRPHETRADHSAEESDTAGLYAQAFTRENLQQLLKAATAPLLDEEVRLLRILIQRVATNGQDPVLEPGRTKRGSGAVPDDPRPEAHRAVLTAKLTAVGRAVDVLQRTLKTRQALASASADALGQLLDEVIARLDEPPQMEQPAAEEQAS